ncbi:MAG: ribonuclease H-like domain-containing protein [Bacteroidia bacterium]|nr:ribonuclease H-like domain-containing protein [Bacteroidia bacterium]
MSFYSAIQLICSTSMSQGSAMEQVLFLDIETVPAYDSISELPETLRAYWDRRYDKHRAQDYSEEEYFAEQAGIHALYARVACIGLGYFEHRTLRWREEALFHLDERELLHDFIQRWERFKEYAKRLKPHGLNDSTYFVCGHNIASFDLPFLGRRLLINRIPLTEFWRTAQWAQPWNLKSPMVIDTMYLWGFTARERTFIPLEVLAHALGIPFQKELSHQQIRQAFLQWKSSGRVEAFASVVDYCLKDVRTVAEIYIHMQGSDSEKDSYLEALRSYNRPST